MSAGGGAVPEQPSLVKCLVWDLDNTLWRGTLAEDGDVRIADEVRAVVETLDSRGVLQSIASKNDHEHAWARLEELGIAEYFVLPKIGWGRKSDAVRQIADELNFAPRAVAFVDDQAAELAEVEYHLPEVRRFSADQVLSLVDLPEFSPALVTVDARRRRAMYQAGFRRDAERAGFRGPDEAFLRTLDLELRIERADERALSRVEELTLRTSQMNATGVHYSAEDLRALCADARHEVLVTSMADRFGPYGAVGVLLLELRLEVWHLKLLATSCRVVSFGAGTVLLNWLSDQAARGGAHLVADYRPTDRNRMMEIAYRFAGFVGEYNCPCRAVIGSAMTDAIQMLHLVPTTQPAPTTMNLIAPDLASVVRAS
jgi:methoxymalonate biosynthesis protein